MSKIHRKALRNFTELLTRRVKGAVTHEMPSNKVESRVRLPLQFDPTAFRKEESMDQVVRIAAKSKTRRALGCAAAALLFAATTLQPIVANAAHGGGGGGGFHGGGGGFHGGGFGGFHGGGFHAGVGGFHGGGFGGFHGGGFHGGGFHGGGFHGGFVGVHNGFNHTAGGHWFHGWHGGRFGWWWAGPGLAWTYYPYGWDYAPDYGYYDYGQDYGQPYAGQYWYYCSDPGGYYPYVTQCNTQWQTVPAS
jgi:hypothetical protein